MSHLRKKYGDYALVTGASAGIGEEFAHQLAAAGLDVVLVARREDRLKALAEALTAQHHIACEVVPVNLGAEGAVQDLARRVEHLAVGMIVTSAGVVTSGPFVGNDLAEELTLVNLDLSVPMQMAHVFGRRFVSHHRGGIILVSSAAGFAPLPYSANYAAAKAYIASFGQALSYELAPAGVDVLTLAPGPTRTEGVKNASGIDFEKLPVPLMPPHLVVEAALRGLGHKRVVIPGRINRINDLVGKHVFSRRLQTAVNGALVRRTLDADPGRPPMRHSSGSTS